MCGEQNRSNYLLAISTSGMMFVMVLIFRHVASLFIILVGLEKLLTPASSNALMSSILLLAILCVLICIIVTLSYIHNEIKIEFRKFYFLIIILLVTLPLYVSVEFIMNANNNILETDQFLFDIFKNGAISISITFIGLIMYTACIYFRDISSEHLKEKLPIIKFIQILFFQFSGLFLSIIFYNFDSKTSSFCLLLLSGLCLTITLSYLIFFWALNAKIDF